MRRKIYDKLTKWKKESNGEVALLIYGARRIGKSIDFLDKPLDIKSINI